MLRQVISSCVKRLLYDFVIDLSRNVCYFFVIASYGYCMILSQVSPDKEHWGSTLRKVRILCDLLWVISAYIYKRLLYDFPIGLLRNICYFGSCLHSYCMAFFSQVSREVCDTLWFTILLHFASAFYELLLGVDVVLYKSLSVVCNKNMATVYSSFCTNSSQYSCGGTLE